MMQVNKIIWSSRKADKSAVGAMNRPLRRRSHRVRDPVFHVFTYMIAPWGGETVWHVGPHPRARSIGPLRPLAFASLGLLSSPIRKSVRERGAIQVPATRSTRFHRCLANQCAFHRTNRPRI